jgi:hypothetical protein
MDTLSHQARSEVQLETGEGSPVRELAWLNGQPPLETYIDFMRDTVVRGSDVPRSALVDEWRVANDYYYDLESVEQGLADRIEVLQLPDGLRPLADEVMASAAFRRGYNVLPTRFALVELRHLVVHQLHVNLVYVAQLRSEIPPAPSPEELFRFCQPLDRTDLAVHARRIASDRFELWSESSDFRFQEAVMLRPEQIDGHIAKGAVAAVVGLIVGFGSNFLAAIQSDSRLLLTNGYHRAYALLEHGVTHAPCLIQTVTRRDELNLIAPGRVQDAPAYYFKAARPPLLKDFLDPRIRKVVRVPRVVHRIDVRFEIEKNQVVG